MPNTQHPPATQCRSPMPPLPIGFQGEKHMDRLVIRGGRRIEGSVQIRGAKNAALPQIAAALLSAEPLELANIPDVTDVNTMLALMREFGVVADRRPSGALVLDAA